MEGIVLSISKVSLNVTSAIRNVFNAISVAVSETLAIPLLASPAGIVALYVQIVESAPTVILVALTSSVSPV